MGQEDKGHARRAGPRGGDLAGGGQERGRGGSAERVRVATPTRGVARSDPAHRACPRWSLSQYGCVHGRLRPPLGVSKTEPAPSRPSALLIAPPQGRSYNGIPTNQVLSWQAPPFPGGVPMKGPVTNPKRAFDSPAPRGVVLTGSAPRGSAPNLSTVLEKAPPPGRCGLGWLHPHEGVVSTVSAPPVQGCSLRALQA